MQDVNLNRFIDRMAQLITKYADAVDWNELEEPDYEKLNIDDMKLVAVSQEDYEVMGSCDGGKAVAETSVSAIFVMQVKKYPLNGFYKKKIQNISIKFNIKRLYSRKIES